MNTGRRTAPREGAVLHLVGLHVRAAPSPRRSPSFAVLASPMAAPT